MIYLPPVRTTITVLLLLAGATGIMGLMCLIRWTLGEFVWSIIAFGCAGVLGLAAWTMLMRL